MRFMQAPSVSTGKQYCPVVVRIQISVSTNRATFYCPSIISSYIIISPYIAPACHFILWQLHEPAWVTHLINLTWKPYSDSICRNQINTISGQQFASSCPLTQTSPSILFAGNSGFKSPEDFKVSLPLRTNYLYGRIKKSLPEMYAFTVCMWLKSSASPGIGTPFSYGVPGQANEIVLIEWGNSPMELLVNDKVSLYEIQQSHLCFYSLCFFGTM